MNDQELDELVSAYLDGEATPDEVARVEADADLLERVERFRSLGDAIAATPTVDTAARDAAIARAVRELDAPVESLAARRATRGLSARSWKIASVAAVVAAVFLTLPFVVADKDGEPDTAAPTSAGSQDGDEVLAAPLGPTTASPEAGEDETMAADTQLDDADRSATEGAEGGDGDASDDGGDAGDSGGDAASDDGGFTTSVPGEAQLDLEGLGQYASQVGLDGLDTDPPTRPAACPGDLDDPVASAFYEGDPMIIVAPGDGTFEIYRADDCTLVVVFTD